MKKRIFIVDADMYRVIEKRNNRDRMNCTARKKAIKYKKDKRQKNWALFIGLFIIIETFLLIIVINNLI